MAHMGGGAVADWAPRSAAWPDLTGLRVLFVVSRFPVLSEAFIAYAAAGLMEAGAELSILPLQQPADAGGRLAHAPVGLLARHDPAATLLCPRHADRITARLAALPGALLGAVRRRGPSALRHLVDTRLRLVFLEEVLAGRPDPHIIHCHFGTLAAPFLRLRAAGLTQARIVVHFRGYDISQALPAAPAAHRAQVFGAADRFIANCAHFRDRAVALGASPGLVDVVPTGLDLAAFPRRPAPAGIGTPLRLLGVGRLVEKKGFADAIRALGSLHRQGVPARLHLLGDGPERPALAALAAAEGVGGAVVWLGRGTHADVLAELAAADILLAPSLSARNGDADAPVNVLKEAMAVGVPVVATRHGGIPELVTDGQTGLLVPEHDPEALAAAVSRLAAAPQEAARMAAAARAEIEAAWSLQRTTALFAQTYHRALAAPPRGGAGTARQGVVLDVRTAG